MSDFLSTITHPNRKALAEALLSGIEPGTLYNEYGDTRVREMQKAIEAYNALPNEKQPNPRAIDNAGCRACRRKPGTCN